MTPAELAAYNANLLQQHQMWLQLPMTRKFFATLKERKQTIQDGAARRAATNTEGEHNNLVRSAELLNLLETYADPATNPYAITDANPGPVPDNE